MLQRTFNLYKNSFEGLSRDIWLLSLITLVNRSGTMVLPFLTVYMTSDLHFSLTDAGIVMSCFGAGSMLGSYIGGKLTDKYGFYWVMFWSLLLGGMSFFSLIFVHSFIGLCITTFIITTIADTFRPAVFAAIAAYSKPENLTRSSTLMRLAINLGFSVGPAAGGILAATVGYHALFLVDGVTCMAAALMFRWFLAPKTAETQADASTSETNEEETIHSPYKDAIFWFFLLITTVNAMIFLQLFTTVPVYFRSFFGFSESQIGYILALNGFLIFLTEMPLVYGVERKFSSFWALSMGGIFIGLSFFVFLWGTPWIGIAVLSIIAITIGEMLNFPFAYTYAVGLASQKHRGQYMALFAMTFSFAHIFAPSLGMQIADNWGYSTLWIILTQASIFVVLGYILLGRISKRKALAVKTA